MWHRLRGTIAIDVSFAHAVPGENRGCFAPKHRLAPNNDSPQSSNWPVGAKTTSRFRRTNSTEIICRAPADAKVGHAPVAPHWLRLSAKAQATADRAATALRMLRRLSNLLFKPRIAIASLFALELQAKRFHETKGFWSNPFSVLEDWLSESRAVGVLRRRRTGRLGRNSHFTQELHGPKPSASSLWAATPPRGRPPPSILSIVKNWHVTCCGTDAITRRRGARSTPE
jgi:hypothetical protein